MAQTTSSWWHNPSTESLHDRLMRCIAGSLKFVMWSIQVFQIHSHDLSARDIAQLPCRAPGPAAGPRASRTFDVPRATGVVYSSCSNEMSCLDSFLRRWLQGRPDGAARMMVFEDIGVHAALLRAGDTERID